ncbi:MAG: hypothetical protein IJJ33_16175, partial [Victivallales bacterium]|nr:hypothetical protein [Victivallales bacterium]
MANRVLGLFVASLLVSCVYAETLAPCEPANGLWSAWGNDQEVIITQGKGERRFRREDGKGGWNTPIFDFLSERMPLVDEFCLLVFDYFYEQGRDRLEIVLKNSDDEARYAQCIKLEPGAWRTAEVHLSSAPYKSGGKAGVAAEGLYGHRLAEVQICFSGVEIALRNVRIERRRGFELPPGSAASKEAVEYAEKRVPPDFRQFRRGAVFPFGVIATVRSGEEQVAKLFGQNVLERWESSIALLRSHGFNAYSNFCECTGTSIKERLAVMARHGMCLMETNTCRMDLHQLPDDHKLVRQIEECSAHPNLLAWYAEDEPQNVPRYIRNKTRMDVLSKGLAPFVSTIHMMSIAKSLGPALDVLMLDPYDLTLESAPNASLDILARHTNVIRCGSGFIPSGRVWMVPQAFSYKLSGVLTHRYPSPEELTFDVFNCMAAGANGFFFYIFRDVPPYLLPDSRRGSVHLETLFDSWGNPNATAEAIAQVGQRLVSIMPSFLERRQIASPRNVQAGEGILVSQWDNGDGILLIAVNSCLTERRIGRMTLELSAGEGAYDLDTLKAFDGQYELAPGDAMLLFIGKPQAFQVIKAEIDKRKGENVAQMAAARPRECAALQSARLAFKEMNS